MNSSVFACAALLGAALTSAACHSPSRVIRPVIHASEEEKYQAMKTAPVIVLAEVTGYELVSGPKKVGKPADGRNPAWMVPLYLARISADVKLALRGGLRGPIQLYSWVWASGQHGGERLFQPYPGYNHILFLRDEGGYLHTVGDYPHYDLEIRRNWLQEVAAGLQSVSPNGSDVFERIVAARLKAEFKTATVISPNYWPLDGDDLAGLTSPFYVASVLDSLCRESLNRFARFAACEAIGSQLRGRCDAYRLARKADVEGVEAEFIGGAFQRCEALEPQIIDWFNKNRWHDAQYNDAEKA